MTLDRLIRLSLRKRGFVLVAALALLVAGGVGGRRVPVDVFPDLTAPTVVVLTEAPGMGPEEIELLVTFPLESALNGAPGLRRIRSLSAAGIAVVWVEFRWGEDVYRARQVISERLAKVDLPEGVEPPELGPISSIMGEITFVALTADSARVSPRELRRVAETVIARGLLAIPGISQVTPIGGEVREYQVELSPASLVQHGIGVGEVAHALEETSANAAAGFHVDRGQEFLVRGMTRARTPEDLASTVVRVTNGVPLRVGDLGTVSEGSEPTRGTAAFGARPAVVLSVQKQPGANTLALMRQVEAVLASLETSLPPGVVVEQESFRQSDFIEAAVGNITHALRDGAILVVVVLFAFLGNLRATFIAALAIPLSLVVAAAAVVLVGGTMNTMTIGGLTIAIGALVDDAIIVVENAFRRLRESAGVPEGQRPDALTVVQGATSEVLHAILFATLIIVLVFVPLFFLPGMEGRLLRPLGFAYVVALGASLLVSLTVTPVLAFLLLRSPRILSSGEPWLMRRIRGRYARDLSRALARPRAVYAVAGVLLAGALVTLPFLGRSFLPPFNEGSLTVSVVSPPGTPLGESDAIGREVERVLLTFDEVVSTTRRTGRAEKDEHVQGVNATEVEVVLREGREKEVLIAEMRGAVAAVPGAAVSFGQPISHRIDHMISGSRSNLAVKVFGRDLSVIRTLTRRIESVLGTIPGIVDVSNQEQAGVPQLLIEADRSALARHGMTAGDLSVIVESAFQGREVGELLADGVRSRVVVRLPERLREHRDQLGEILVVTRGGRPIRLDDVAEIRFDLGPSLVRRENVERVGMVTANVAGADLAGTVDRARRAVDAAIDLPRGYRVHYGGQFEEGAKSARTLGGLSVVIVFAMYGLLFVAFRSHRHTLIVLVNLPLAMIGGVFAVALGDGVLSIAALVGFITLFGIATRNGVLLVTRYEDLLAEGLDVAEAVRRGSLERLGPVLMTAITAGLALVPLVLAGGRAGNEIQSPMGQVLIGGLVTSTFLNLVVVPVLFARFGLGRSARV